MKYILLFILFPFFLLAQEGVTYPSRSVGSGIFKNTPPSSYQPKNGIFQIDTSNNVFWIHKGNGIYEKLESNSSNSIYQLDDNISLDSSRIEEYLQDSSIVLNDGDLLIQKGKFKPITSYVPIDQGSIRDRYAAFPTVWKTENNIYTLYREGESHTLDGSVKFANSIDNGLTWNTSVIASNPDLETDYGLASSGIYVNDTSHIIVTYRRGVNYDTETTPIFDSTLVYFIKSEDDGVTWSTPILITTPTIHTVFSETKTAKIGTRLFHPYYDYNTNKAGVAYSDNEDFSSWNYVEFPNPESSIGSATMNETSLVINGSQLIAFIRTSDPNCTLITRSVSNDNGITWTVPVNVTFPSDFIELNGAHPNSILLPTGQLLTHARHDTDQYQAILVSNDLGITYDQMLLTEPNELSMYMDFILYSSKKIGISHSKDFSGSGADLYFSTIDIPSSSIIEKTKDGLEYLSLGSLGGGFDVGDIYNISAIGKPFTDGFTNGSGFTEDRLLDLGNSNRLIIGSDAHEWLFTIRGDENGNEKVVVGATTETEINSNTGRKFEVYGQIGAGNNDTDVLAIGHSAYNNGLTAGLRSVIVGIASATNSTTVSTSNIIGQGIAPNSPTISTSNLVGYKVGGSTSGNFSNSEIIGANGFSGSSSVANVVSIGYNNGRSNSGAASNRVWLGGGLRYYNGDNSLIIGNSIFTSSSDPLNDTDDLFRLGMNTDILMEATIGEKFVQINDILRLPDASTLPAGYTATAGDIRWNGSTLKHQGYDGTSWNDLY